MIRQPGQFVLVRMRELARMRELVRMRELAREQGGADYDVAVRKSAIPFQ